MRVRALLIPVLVAGLATACGPQERPLSSEKGRFSVVFPGPVKTRKQVLDAPGHRFDVYYYESQSKDGRKSCFVGYFDAADPDSPFLPEPLEMLTEAWDAMIKASAWRRRRTQPHERNGFPGAQMLVNVKSQSGWRDVILLTYVAGVRIYFVSSEVDGEAQTAVSGNRCLDSFEIHPPPKPKVLF